MLPGGALPWDALSPVVDRIAPLGWHVQIQMDGRLLAGREALLKRLPCPVVFDHLGRLPPGRVAGGAERAVHPAVVQTWSRRSWCFIPTRWR